MNNLLATIALGAAIISTQAFAQDDHGDRAGWTQRDMTRQQAQQMADDMFQRFDSNHDGVLTRQEAEQAAAQFGGSGRAEKMIGRMFGDSQSLTLQQAEAQALSRFDRDDLNHDGTVTGGRAQAGARCPQGAASSTAISSAAVGASTAAGSISPALGRDEHPEQHGDRAGHPNLALEPQADGRARDSDRLGKVVLSAVAEAAHRRSKLIGRHGGKHFAVVAHLDCVGSPVAGPDSDRLLHVENEDLSVADAAGPRGILDRLNYIFDERIFDHHLDLHLGEKVDHIFGAAVKLGMPLLPAEALDLGDRDARTPTSCRASFTSSSLNGLMIASIFFTAAPL